MPATDRPYRVSRSQAERKTDTVTYMSPRVYTNCCIFLAVNPAPETLFSALAHPTRLRCVVLLLANSELCVCELTHAIGVSQPSVSRHLAQLRDTGLVKDRRDGLWIHYRINPELPQWARDVLERTALGVGDDVPFCDDRMTLVGMPNRPSTPRCA